MQHDNRPSSRKDRNYSMNLSAGTHPDCWFFTITQGAQTFSMYAETPPEKKNYLDKLHSLRVALEKTITTLEQQT